MRKYTQCQRRDGNCTANPNTCGHSWTEAQCPEHPECKLTGAECTCPVDTTDTTTPCACGDPVNGSDTCAFCGEPICEACAGLFGGRCAEHVDDFR